MRIRKVLPRPNVIAPVNTKPIVLTIGNGDETHVTVDLELNGESVQAEQEITCYIHEGDEEYHCTYLLNPLEELQPDTYYYVSVISSEVHPEPGMDSGSWFKTSTNRLSMPNTAPETRFLGYMDRELSAVQECDWNDAKKYEILTSVATASPDFLSIIQVYEVHDTQTGDESLVHSIILPPGLDSTNYRQVIRPGDEEPFKCFRAVHRDVAGNESTTSETICYDE
jgi:hypothetical protein